MFLPVWNKAFSWRAQRLIALCSVFGLHSNITPQNLKKQLITLVSDKHTLFNNSLDLSRYCLIEPTCVHELSHRIIMQLGTKSAIQGSCLTCSFQLKISLMSLACTKTLCLYDARPSNTTLLASPVNCRSCGH